jgi:glutathione reductase (NADPH)
VSDRVFGGKTGSKLDYNNIPTVVFRFENDKYFLLIILFFKKNNSHPPIGTVGLTEEEARKKHGDQVKVSFIY